MSITFDNIPLTLRTPGTFVEFNSTRAVSGPGVQPHRVLLIGQKLVAGIAPVNTLVRLVSPAAAIQQFGRGSMLAQMAEAFFANNPTAEAFGLALADNGAGVAAQKTVTVSGTATQPGTINLYVGGRRLQAAVATGMTAAQAATALGVAAQADSDIAMTAQVGGAVMTLTARHKGVAGNEIDLRTNYLTGEATPPGLTIVCADSTPGTGNPDVAAVFTAIGDEWFNSFVLPYTDAASLNAFDTELASRWGPMRMIEGVAYAFRPGTQGDLAALGGARNGPFVSIGGMKGSPTWSPVFAAAYAGQVSASAALDPARPFQTLILRGVLAPAAPDRFTRQERDLLLRDGISTFTVDSGGNVLIERPVTTYQLDAYGLEDVAYLDVNTITTLGYLRYSMRARVNQKYPRHKLAEDGTLYGPGQAVVTPKVVKAEIVSLAVDWEKMGLVEDLEQFKAELIVERDLNDRNRLNVRIPANLVNQFRVFAGLVDFRL